MVSTGMRLKNGKNVVKARTGVPQVTGADVFQQKRRVTLRARQNRVFVTERPSITAAMPQKSLTISKHRTDWDNELDKLWGRVVDGSGAKMVAESSSCPERLPTLPKKEESTSHISIASVNGSSALLIEAHGECDDSQSTHDLSQEEEVGDGDGDDEEKATRPASAAQVQCGTSTAAVKVLPSSPPPPTPHPLHNVQL